MVQNSWSCFAIESLWVQYGGTDFDIKTKKALGDLDGQAEGWRHTCNTSLFIFRAFFSSSSSVEDDIRENCKQHNMICLNPKRSWKKFDSFKCISITNSKILLVLFETIPFYKQWPTNKFDGKIKQLYQVSRFKKVPVIQFLIGGLNAVVGVELVGMTYCAACHCDRYEKRCIYLFLSYHAEVDF